MVVPARDACPYCGRREKMEMTQLSPHGEVVSYTTLHMPPEGFDTPLHLALIHLDDGATVLCLREDEASNQEVTVGMRVTLTADDRGRFRFGVA